jgi:hypothetical protein
MHVGALEFLLGNGHCGLSNTVRLNDLVVHVNSRFRTHLSREQFQNNVLVDLKRRGTLATLVYPGRRGGVFIPCIEDEAIFAARQVVERVVQELLNVEGVSRGTRIHPRIARLRALARVVRSRL